MGLLALIASFHSVQAIDCVCLGWGCDQRNCGPTAVCPLGGCNQDGLENPICALGHCSQKDAIKPFCGGGWCDQSQSTNPTCGGGYCCQEEAEGAECFINCVNACNDPDSNYEWAATQRPVLVWHEYL